MAKVLKVNRTLEKVKFQECPECRWEEDSKAMFVEMLKTCGTNLTKAKFVPHDKNDDTQGHNIFKKEVEFSLKKTKGRHKSVKDFEERIESCSTTYMVEQMLKLVEDKDEHKKMPVRKFFNNTFSVLLNDALFQLSKE